MSTICHYLTYIVDLNQTVILIKRRQITGSK